MTQSGYKFGPELTRGKASSKGRHFQDGKQPLQRCGYFGRAHALRHTRKMRDTGVEDNFCVQEKFAFFLFSDTCKI